MGWEVLLLCGYWNLWIHKLSSWPAATPVKKFKLPELRSAIKQLRSHQAPGHGLITGRILNELPDKGIRAAIQILNSVLRTGYYPGQWKVFQIIAILKPAEELTSFRPISSLPIPSKLFEKLLLTRIKPILQETRIVPAHQFGYRQKHTTTGQVRRITNVVYKALESNKYRTAALLGSGQAFDKVWHEGLIYKIKTLFPNNIYKILKSYLEK